MDTSCKCHFGMAAEHHISRVNAEMRSGNGASAADAAGGNIIELE